MRKMYSKKQVEDIVLESLENASEVAIGGDLDVTGSIEGSEIIEKMEGYSFTLGTHEKLTIEGVYAGAVKNGNKLTLVIALDITRTDTVSGDMNLGVFNIPADVSEKLIPAVVGLYSYLDNKVVNAWANDATTKELQLYCNKGTNSVRPYFNQDPINQLSLNTKYYVRYEVTFLLSENLIPSE